MQASTKKGGVHININPCCVCDSLFIFYPQHCVITSRWLVYFIGIPFQAIKESEREGYQSTYRKPVVRMYVSHLKWMASGGIRTMAIQSSLPWSQTSVSSPPHWTPSLRQLTHTHLPISEIVAYLLNTCWCLLFSCLLWTVRARTKCYPCFCLLMAIRWDMEDL